MKKVSLIFSAVLITAMIVTSCGGSSKSREASKEVTIGDQVWMTKNLNVDTFRNGDPIPEVKTDEEWKKAGENGQPTWCYYDNNSDNVVRYGRLYNWYAVNDPRGLAPEGWKVPSADDWSRLIDYLGGMDVAGKKMKFTDFWADYNGKTGIGTNESGFSGLPGGRRNDEYSFNGIDKYGYWWSTTEYKSGSAQGQSLDYDYDGSIKGVGPKMDGYSVRCIKD